VQNANAAITYTNEKLLWKHGIMYAVYFHYTLNATTDSDKNMPIFLECKRVNSRECQRNE